jgi:hypothetical protein
MCLADRYESVEGFSYTVRLAIFDSVTGTVSAKQHHLFLSDFGSVTNTFSKAITSGDHSRGVPLVPIPNTIVKPSHADGTWTAGSWESK